MTDTILEKDTLSVTVGDDHSFACSVVTLGRTGENAVSQLEINIPEELNNFWAYLDFKKASGKTVKTPRLDIVNNKIEYDIPGGLLDESGNIEIQLVLESEKGEVWKSSTKKFVVLKSIDAGNDIPEAESFISEAQKILDETVETTNAFIAEVEKENEAFKEEIEKTADNFIAESNKKIDEALVIRDGYASAITETASGEVVSLTDISPIEHTLKIKCKSYAISNMSRTIITEEGGESANADVSEVFAIHDKILFGSWLESIAGDFGEKSFSVVICRPGLWASDTNIWVTIGGKHWESNEATNSYLKENCGFTFDCLWIDDNVYLNISKGLEQKMDLIPYPYADTTKTVSGITFTDNGDGTITANGTATGNADFMVSDSIAVKKGMTISGAPDGSRPETFEIQAYKSGDEMISTNGIYSPTAIVDFVSPVRIRIRSGYKANNLVFKPQLLSDESLSKVNGFRYTISNFSRTSYPLYEGEGIGTDVSEVFIIHDNNLFGSWLESLVGGFGEETVMFRIKRPTVATPNEIYVEVFKNDEWKHCWSNHDESDTGYDEEGIYGTKSYLEENFGFTFDEGIDVNSGNCYEEDTVSFLISTKKLIKSGKNLARVNSVSVPLTSNVTIFEGEISGDFVLSCDKSNLKDIVNPTAALFEWTFKDGTKENSLRVDHFNGANISGVITKVELLRYCGAKSGSVDNIQLEPGTTKTEFEPFNGLVTYPINPDGTVDDVTSLYPTTTLLSDTEGVGVDVEYNVDTKKYVNNLINKKIAEVMALALEV